MSKKKIYDSIDIDLSNIEYFKKFLDEDFKTIDFYENNEIWYWLQRLKIIYDNYESQLKELKKELEREIENNE